MTKNSMRHLVLAASLLALTACSGGGHEAEGGAEAHAAKQSSAGLPHGDVAAGEALASAPVAPSTQSCVECHGKDGNQPDPKMNAPKIGGQYRDYLAHALQQYRDGSRTNSLMAPNAAHLNDQQIADLSAYFASRPSELSDLSHL